MRWLDGITCTIIALILYLDFSPMVGLPAYKYKVLITKIIQIFGHLSILIHTHTHTLDLISFVVCCNWSFKRTEDLGFYQIKERSSCRF